MAVEGESGRDLSVGQCRERLLASRHGFVSCTRFAMPLIVPADAADSPRPGTVVRGG